MLTMLVNSRVFLLVLPVNALFNCMVILLVVHWLPDAQPRIDIL